MRRSRIVAIAGALAGMLIGAGDAEATTICVPDFTAACPNSGGNVKKADLEEAMSFQGEDGKADEIHVAAGTFTETGGFEPEPGFSSPESFEPHGTDPLTIAGSGTGSTFLTSAGTKNVYLVNLDYNNTRAIAIRDLTVRIPASFPDGGANGYGAAFQLHGDVLERVDIVTLNDGSGGIESEVGPGNVFRNGEVRGEAGARIGDGLRAGGAAGGSLLVEDAVVRGASWPLIASEAGSHLTARRVKALDSRTYGAIATRGTLDVENSLFTLVDGVGLYASASTVATSLTADQITVVDEGASYPAIQIEKTSGEADVSVSVSNSILRGFSAGYVVNAAAGPGIGHGTLTARYSNFPSTGTSSGILDLSTGNIDADPLLSADLSLPPSSPSVDAGDPGPGTTTDLLGAARPVDGNGDGLAVRDQGAFEYQPPPAPPEPPTPTADAEPPQTRIVQGPGKALAKGVARFRFRSSEAGSAFLCKLDRRKAARCGSPRIYRHLKPGRHLFKVWAIDAAGNKDPTPAKRKFRVPAAA
jgi:hypothetical protein